MYLLVSMVVEMLASFTSETNLQYHSEKAPALTGSPKGNKDEPCHYLVPLSNDIYLTPLLGHDMTQGQFLSGV